MASERNADGRRASGFRLKPPDGGPAAAPPAGDEGPAGRVGALELAGRSWAMLLRHADIFIMLMWRPFAVSAAAAYGAIELSPHAGPDIAGLLFTIVSMIAVVPVITAWHRMVLMGADNPSARVVYRLGRAEWAYLKAAAVLYGLGYVTGLAVTAIYGPLLGGPILWLVRAGYDPWGLLAAWGPPAVTWLCVAVILGFLVARFFLVLPALAIGGAMSFAESAAATRGNGTRLVCAYILASLPAAALMAVFDPPAAVLAAERAGDQKFLDLIAAILPRILLYTVAVGILSLAYQRLVGVPRRMMR